MPRLSAVGISGLQAGEDVKNHYHIVVETPEGNLSQGMSPLNGVYMQRVMRNTGIRASSCVLFKAPEAEASA